MGFLTWFRRREEVLPRAREILERLETVEDDVVFLRKRINKLQGHITGGMRNGEAPVETPDAPTVVPQHYSNWEQVRKANELLRQR
jgi:hypothetical protein